LNNTIYITREPNFYRNKFTNGIINSFKYIDIYYTSRKLPIKTGELKKITLKFILTSFIVKKKYSVAVFNGYSNLHSLLIIFLNPRLTKVLQLDGKVNEKSRFFRLQKIILTRFAYIMSPGESIDKILIDRFSINPNKIIRVVFSSLYLNEIIFKRNFYGGHNRNIQALSVGRLVKEKGFLDLLNLVENISIDKLNIIGKGPLESKMLQIVSNTKVNVDITGFVSHAEVLSSMASSELFILLSHYDVWGLSVSEALSQGMFVISTLNCQSAVELNLKFSDRILLLEEPYVNERNINMINEFIKRIKYTNVVTNHEYIYSIENMVSSFNSTIEEIQREK